MPLHPEPVRSDERRGRAAEDAMVGTLRSLRNQGRLYTVAFPDAIVVPWPGARPYCVELKSQERFKAPPFDGHGLSVLQADEYEALRAVTEIDTRLTIWEPSGDAWHAWLSNCAAGRRFETAGTIKHPRRVFPIDSFTKGRWP